MVPTLNPGRTSIEDHSAARSPHAHGQAEAGEFVTARVLRIPVEAVHKHYDVRSNLEPGIIATGRAMARAMVRRRGRIPNPKTMTLCAEHAAEGAEPKWHGRDSRANGSTGRGKHVTVIPAQAGIQAGA